MRKTRLFTVVLRTDAGVARGTWKLLARSKTEAVRVIDTQHLRPFLRGTGKLVAVGDGEDYPTPTKAGERLTVAFTKPPQYPTWPATTWKAYTDDGKVWRWVESDNCVPEEAAMEFGIPIDRAAQAAASEKASSESIAKYRAAMAARTPDEVAADRAEARAAMGPGVAMVNVFTDETYTT